MAIKKEFAWQEQLGTVDDDWSTAVATDGVGNVYVAGFTEGSLEGDSAGDYDIWLAKYNSAGTQQWIEQLGTSGNDRATAVATDGVGNVYVTGFTEGSLEGDSAGDYDIWLAKYDGEGNQLWIEQFGTSGFDRANAVATDGLGNVYVAGYTQGSLKGDSAGGFDIWLAKYDGDKNQLWIEQLGTSGYDEATDLDTDGLGNVYITGTTRGSLEGDSAGGFDIWLAKYDGGGNKLWIEQFGTSGNDWADAVATDGVGNVYIAGSTEGSLKGASAGDYDIWLAKYDGDKNQLWIEQLGTSGYDRAFAVATDGVGNVYVTGYTQGSLKGDSAGGFDIWLAKYDGSKGTQLWIKQLGTGSDDSAAAVATDGVGNVYVTGFTRGSLEGDSVGGYDIWLGKVEADRSATIDKSA